MGGETTVENIQLRCRAHNGYEADLFYGAGPNMGKTSFVNRARPMVVSPASNSVRTEFERHERRQRSRPPENAGAVKDCGDRRASTE
jgi:hypothetical protein